MTHRLRHPFLDGTVVGVVASMLAAFTAGWAVARHYLGPRNPKPRSAA